MSNEKPVTVQSAMNEYGKWVAQSIREGMGSHLTSVHEYLKLMIGLASSSFVVTVSIVKVLVPSDETIQVGYLLAGTWLLQLIALALLLYAMWLMSRVQMVDMIPSSIEDVVMQISSAVIEHNFTPEELMQAGGNIDQKIDAAIDANVGLFASTVQDSTDQSLENLQANYDKMLLNSTRGSIFYFVSLLSLMIWATIQYL